MSVAPTSAREQLQQWGVLAVMALLLIGLGLFVFLVLLPDVRRRADYQAALVAARSDLELAQQAQLEAPARLRNQLSAADARLDEVAGRFLNEAESTIIVNRLYTYADAAGVEIVNLQAAPALVNPTHVQRDYRFRVAGAVVPLLRFLGSIQEATLPGFVVNSVSLVPNTAPVPSPTGGINTHTLEMNVIVVSSPYSTRTVLGPAQDAMPYANVGDLPLAEVQRQVELAWLGRRWDQAINLLNQVITASPTNAAAHMALYRAHVNAGYHHLIKRDYAAATAAFEDALAVFPEGTEAANELQQLVRDTTLSHRVEDELRQTLSAAKASGQWQEVIRVLRIIAAVDPEYGPVGEELTAAYINYGNQLAQAGDMARAEEQYQLAQYPNAGQTSPATIPTPVPPVSVSVAPQLIPTATLVPTPLPTALPATIPAGAAPAAPLTAVPPIDAYVVQSGDTLVTIAQAHGITVEALMQVNGLQSTSIYVGQQLRIPTPLSVVPRTTPVAAVVP